MDETLRSEETILHERQKPEAKSYKVTMGIIRYKVAAAFPGPDKRYTPVNRRASYQRRRVKPGSKMARRYFDQHTLFMARVVTELGVSRFVTALRSPIKLCNVI